MILFFSRMHRLDEWHGDLGVTQFSFRTRESYVRSRGGRGRGEEGHRREESSVRTKKKRYRRWGKQNRTNLHRDRIIVAYPSLSHARTKTKKKRRKRNLLAHSISRTPFFDQRISGTWRANRKGQQLAATMVYESDFYTTRRPYSRPLASSYTVSVSILRIWSCFFCTKKERAGSILIMFFFCYTWQTNVEKEREPRLQQEVYHPL